MAGLVSFARAYFVDNPAVQNIQLGMGYNSLLGQTTQPAVVDRSPVRPPGGPQAVQYSLHICSSTEELNQALSVSASASYGSSLFGSVSGRADFARSLSQHRYYLYLAVRCTVINASTYLTDPAASPEFAKLTGGGTIDWKRFYDRFGDSYVSSFQTGGEFIGILRWQTTTLSEQTKVAAEVKGHFTSVSFDAQSSAQLSSLKTSSDYQVFVYRNGSHGGVPAAQNMVDSAREFPSAVESQGGNATIYGFAVQDYASLVPAANLPSVANRLARLQEYAGWATRAAVSASDVSEAPLSPSTRSAWAASARNALKRIADTVNALAASPFADPDTPAQVDPDVVATVEALEYNLTNPITQTNIVPPGQWIDASWGPAPTLDQFVTRLVFYIDGDKIRGVSWSCNDGSYQQQADLSSYPYPFDFNKDGKETLASCTIAWTGYGYNTPLNVTFSTNQGHHYNPGLGGGPVILDNQVSGRRIAGIFGARNPDNFIQSIGFYLGVVPKPMRL